MAAQHGKENSSALLDKFHPFGGWMAPPEDWQPMLKAKVAADVVVVGAGVVGLSTALELAERGVDVVVLEQECARFGASGRNAGYLAGIVGVEFDLFAKRVGLQKARILSVSTMKASAMWSSDSRSSGSNAPTTRPELFALPCIRPKRKGCERAWSTV